MINENGTAFLIFFALALLAAAGIGGFIGSKGGMPERPKGDRACELLIRCPGKAMPWKSLDGHWLCHDHYMAEARKAQHLREMHND